MDEKKVHDEFYYYCIDNTKYEIQIKPAID